jgi:hypothetical protein
LSSGWAGDVALGYGGVAVLGEQIARGPDEQRSVWHVARGARRGRELDGPAQMAFVGFGHRSPPSIVVHARSRVEHVLMVSVPAGHDDARPHRCGAAGR